MHATRSSQETATEAVQVFGGRGITRTGMGQYIEHVSGCVISAYVYCSLLLVAFSITEPFRSILFLEEVQSIISFLSMLEFELMTFFLCVAEDVLGDLGVRQAVRGMPKNARL